MSLSINGLSQVILGQKTKLAEGCHWFWIAIVVVINFQSICEQHKLSIHTNMVICTKFKADWTILKYLQLWRQDIFFFCEKRFNHPRYLYAHTYKLNPDLIIFDEYRNLA